MSSERISWITINTKDIVILIIWKLIKLIYKERKNQHCTVISSAFNRIIQMCYHVIWVFIQFDTSGHGVTCVYYKLLFHIDWVENKPSGDNLILLFFHVQTLQRGFPYSVWGASKRPPTSFSPVTSTNVWISPKNFLTFSFDPFIILV